MRGEVRLDRKEWNEKERIKRVKVREGKGREGKGRERKGREENDWKGIEKNRKKNKKKK